jgi:probable F420-dependent oxidoreductase
MARKQGGSKMRIGVVFPQTEIGGDVAAVRAYALRVEELGYRHVLAYDHVVGADPAVHTGWQGPYDVTTTFHEPFVLFGYIAGITSLELVTGIIILPQRQTALVAKQAAEVDLLTGGRFRLGVGLGWNAVEYEALGQDFSSRGRRVEEQVELLRRLWTERSVTHHGTYDRVTGAGLAPLPVQRPIPIWFGAQSERAYRRAGRLADGWFPQVQPGPQLDAARRVVEQAAAEAGRDPARLGMEGRISWRGSPDKLASHAATWRDVGASRISVNTMGSGLRTVDEHLGVLETAAEVLKPLGE